MDLGIKGKTALVTGGSQGIGAGISEELLKNGATVIITSRSSSALEAFLKKHDAHKKNLILKQGPLTEENSVETLVDDLKSENISVDILVNNAGHTFNITDPYCSQDDWNKIMALNFYVPVRLSNAVIPEMKKKGWGRIVNITSCAGLENSGPVTYSVSKAALTAYTRSMGRVLATESDNVVMVAVYPGVIATKGGHWEQKLKDDPEHAKKYLAERCPLGRFGREHEFTPVVAFYCSQYVKWSHGAIIPVDGGQSKHYSYFNYLE